MNRCASVCSDLAGHVASRCFPVSPAGRRYWIPERGDGRGNHERGHHFDQNSCRCIFWLASFKHLEHMKHRCVNRKHDSPDRGRQQNGQCRLEHANCRIDSGFQSFTKMFAGASHRFGKSPDCSPTPTNWQRVAEKNRSCFSSSTLNFSPRCTCRCTSSTAARTSRLRTHRLRL